MAAPDPGIALRCATIGCLALVLLLTPSLAAAGLSGSGSLFDSKAFVDPTDHWFDLSNYLLNKRGLLFDPIVITEPAIGYGGGGALLYFGKSKEDEEKAAAGEVLGLPPTITFAMGAGTENGTWAAGAGQLRSWRKDAIRYRGGAGYAAANLDFFVGDASLAYSLDGAFVIQELEARLARTPLFLGGRYVFAHLDSALDTPFGSPSARGPFGALGTKNIGGLGTVFYWDTRNNIISPTDGELLEVAPVFFGPWMGGDDWFQELSLEARTFNRLHERFQLNARADAQLSFMDTPFYALPRVNLRGVSATRYQGPYAGEVEFEGWWRCWKRLSLIGFFGMGWVAGQRSGLLDNRAVVPAGGAGFRYLIARQLGMNAGMDFAGSQDQFAFYFQVGSAWH